MAPPKRPWFRFYTEALTDPKLRRLNPAQRWLWVAVLGAARQSPTPGLLLLTESEPLTDADLADLAGLPEKHTAEGLAAMARLGLISRDENTGCWQVTKWNDRQFESDDTTKRTAKHRTKERSINADVADQRQRQKTETETPPSSRPPVTTEDLWMAEVAKVYAARTTQQAALTQHIAHPRRYEAKIAREFDQQSKALELQAAYPTMTASDVGKYLAGEESVLWAHRGAA